MDDDLKSTSSYKNSELGKSKKSKKSDSKNEINPDQAKEDKLKKETDQKKIKVLKDAVKFMKIESDQFKKEKEQ
jgi:hypothetical protein